MAKTIFLVISEQFLLRLLLRFFLPLSETVFVFSGDEDEQPPSHSPESIPTLCLTIQRDEFFSILDFSFYKICYCNFLFHHMLTNFPINLLYPLRFYPNFAKMADNLRRALQDIDLGANNNPIPLPVEVVNQAAAENRFSIVGKPVMPRRQNIRSIVAARPRLWGQGGLIHGRVLEGRRFQFVFPSEKSMELVLRRDPWAFADRMLILQIWTPLLNMMMLNFIPLWIQIRGIPFQFMNQEVVAHIGRAMGQLMDINYNAATAATAAQVEYVRVRLN